MIRFLDLHRADLKFRDLRDGIEGGIGQHIGRALNKMEGDEDRILLQGRGREGRSCRACMENFERLRQITLPQNIQR